nr:helix-turn-helix transcriptional regulator [Leptospira santarosai]
MNSDEFRKKLGKRIQKLRISSGLTQEQMDEGEFSVHYRTIQEIESGRANPTVNTLFRISKRLKIKPQELFDI